MAGLFDLALDKCSRSNRHRWVPHQEQVDCFLREDDQDKYVYDKGKHGPKPRIVCLASLVVQGEGMTQAVLGQHESKQTMHLF